MTSSKSLLFILFCAPLMVGCYSGKHIVDIQKPNGTMGVSEYHTVEMHDPVTHISAGLEGEANTEFSTNLAIRYIHGSFLSGIWTANLNYQYFNRSNIFDDYEQSRFAPPFHSSVTYTYPLLKSEKQGRARIPLIDLNGGAAAYTIDNNSTYLQALSLEGGLGYSSDNFRTDKWAEDKILESSAEITFPQGFPNGNAYVNQGVIAGYVGLKFSNFLNTYISGSSDGHDFRGVKKELLDIRMGIRPLILSFSDEIAYTYRVTENSQTETITENVAPSSFLDKSWIGHTVGVSYTNFRPSSMNLTYTYFAEWGVPPGFKEKYFNTMYIRFGIMFGFDPNARKLLR